MVDSYYRHCHVKYIGSLSNNDGNVNENGKKAIDLDYFFTARLLRESAYFHVS